MAKDSFFSKHWAEKKKSLTDSRTLGVVRVWSVGRRLHVNAPLHDDFKKGAHELSGTYRPRTGIWTFRIQSRRLVMALLEGVYGKDSISSDEAL